MHPGHVSGGDCERCEGIRVALDAMRFDLRPEERYELEHLLVYGNCELAGEMIYQFAREKSRGVRSDVVALIHRLAFGREQRARILRIWTLRWFVICVALAVHGMAAYLQSISPPGPLSRFAAGTAMLLGWPALTVAKMAAQLPAGLPADFSRHLPALLTLQWALIGLAGAAFIGIAKRRPGLWILAAYAVGGFFAWLCVWRH